MFSKQAIAYEIHELLDIPLAYNGYASKGKQLIDLIVTIMREALRRGETVEITGLGTFQVVQRKVHSSGPVAMKILTGCRYETTVRSKAPKTSRNEKTVKFTPARRLVKFLDLD